MNKNLKLFLGLSLMSVLSVVLFSAKNNMASAADASGYGYSCSSVYGYGNTCTTSVGGTYTPTSVNTVFSGGQIVSVNDLLNNTTPSTTTTTTVNTPMIINLSNGSTSSYGYGNTTTFTSIINDLLKQTKSAM